MVIAYLALATVAVVLWASILVKFYKNWVKRHNPISLSICAAVALLIWLAIAGIWDVSGTIKTELVTFASTGISVVVGFYANFTFYLAKKKFKESRD